MTFAIFTGHFHIFIIVAIIIGHGLIRRSIICGKSLSLQNSFSQAMGR